MKLLKEKQIRTRKENVTTTTSQNTVSRSYGNASSITPDFNQDIADLINVSSFVQVKRYINAVPDVNSHLALALIEGREIKTDFLFYEALWVKDSWASKHRGKAVEYGGSRFYK